MTALYTRNLQDPRMSLIDNTSECFQRFGYGDFDVERVKHKYPYGCPVASCSTKLVNIQDESLFCSAHGIRLHSNTYAYWNGLRHKREAQLRNFWIRPDLARDFALGAVGKAESHRLGYEMSEDALSWNVFVGLAEAGKLREVARFLTGREIDAEPSLYLWGELITASGERKRFQPLDAVRNRLEKDIRRFKTEPDVMLVVDGRLVICIEAKFGSGNPLAHEGKLKADQKPVDCAGLLRRYLDQAGPETKRIIERHGIGKVLHSQLFRNVVFASEMASGREWHVVNLVSTSLWKRCRSREPYAYINAASYVRSYLHKDYQNCFSFRTWEELYVALIKDDLTLDVLNTYFQSKSAHYRRAFVIQS